MQGVVLDALPALVGGLSPNKDLAVVGARGEDVAELGMSPSNLPNGTFMPAKRIEQLLARAVSLALRLLGISSSASWARWHGEDLDGAVRGAGGQQGAKVVESTVMDHIDICKRNTCQDTTEV